MGTEIEKLQALLQDDPSNFQARRELSVLLANEGFNEEALSNLKYLLKYFPDDPEIYYNLGIQYEKLKDFESAKEAYEKAVAISPQEDFYYNLGEVLVNLKEWDRAIEAFKTVLKKDPEDGNCYFNLGVCYYNKDEINLATDNFQKAVEINPKDIYAYFYLGAIYQNSSLTNFAVENYNKVLEISPDYSWAYFNLAAIAYKNNNLDDAKAFLLKTIRYNPSDIEAYKLLTKICVKQNEIEEIITLLETRLQEENNGDLFYVLGQVYRHVGKEEEYADCLNDALENSLTLTYPKQLVLKESNMIEDRLEKMEAESVDTADGAEEEKE